MACGFACGPMYVRRITGMGRPPTTFVQFGQRIGRGTVIEPEIRVVFGRNERRAARLQCDCGAVYAAPMGSLVERNGRINTTSCGCAQREAASETGKRTIAQVQAARWEARGLNGLAAKRKREHTLWSNMMARCYNPDYPKYRYWGGRGIRVCERWHDFRLFLEDIDRLLGSCPPRYTLDRIHPDDDYAPGKVRWASYSTQNRNRRKQEGTTSRYMGVSWNARNRRWQAGISIAGRTVRLGEFDSEEMASAAYQAALRVVSDS